MHLNFCVDADWIESLIELGFIAYVSSYKLLTDGQLRLHLDKKAEYYKEVVTISNLDKLVEDTLHFNIKNSDARCSVEKLFISYHSLLRRNGLFWLIKENEKIAVFYILSAFRPESLRTSLESDLELSHYTLRKDLRDFYGIPYQVV